MVISPGELEPSFPLGGVSSGGLSQCGGADTPQDSLLDLVGSE